MRRQVTSVWLRRAEGPINELTEWLEFGTFEDANRQLRVWASTAPDSGGYDKCDFKIVYNNNEEDDAYEGRFDLERKHWGQPDLLQEHIRDFVTWYWGVRAA